jgi:hypothetical protein
MLSCSSVTHPRKDLFRALAQQDCQQHGHREQAQDGEDEYEHVSLAGGTWMAGSRVRPHLANPRTAESRRACQRGEAVRAEKPVHRSDQQGCSLTPRP